MTFINCVFYIFLGHFCPLGSGSETLVSAVDLIKSLTWNWINTDLTLKLAQIRIRIHNTLVGSSSYTVTGFSLLTFGKVAEMLIHPMLENIEHPELI